jgi:hypothetical protein
MRFRLTLLLLLLAVPAAAQNRPPAFGCPAAVYRQFDFWVGDWEVTVSGNAAGRNTITLEEQGCLIHEHWTGSKGGTGQSFNFYDQVTQRWNQVWVDNQGSSLRLSGTFADGKMQLTGVAPGPNGATLQQRLTFFRNPDGTVRQLWETSEDGASWKTAFDGLYRHRSS